MCYCKTIIFIILIKLNYIFSISSNALQKQYEQYNCQVKQCKNNHLICCIFNVHSTFGGQKGLDHTE